MEILGRVRNGVVVLDEGTTIPEGTRVAVLPIPAVPAEPPPEKRYVEFPLVRTGTPGTWNLTNEQIAEFLNEDDVAALTGRWNAPS
jgi:hypothetical protein